MKFSFVKSGEPPADPAGEAEEVNPYLDHSDHWERANRPAWQQHSSLGPNVEAEGRVVRFQPLEAIVNPQDHDYSVRKTSLSLDSARATWEGVRETSSVYQDASLHRHLLGDDFQQLFLDIVLRHAAALLDAATSVPLSPLHVNSAAALLQRVKPLRLFLLGTAGTGKTHTVQTTLQELRRLLAERGYPASFVQVGAPTGPAAFNLRFNATTIHRLIHHRDLRRPFGELRGEMLADLQNAFTRTFLIVLDEVSMIDVDAWDAMRELLSVADHSRRPETLRVSITSVHKEKIWVQNAKLCK